MSNDNKCFIRIKQIGRGSFSNVYLCKHNRISTILMEESYINDDLFIIKEININTLVKKYASKNSGDTPSNYVLQNIQNRINNKNNESPFKIDITPYTHKYRTASVNPKFYKGGEYDYYSDRLRDLIDSEVDILMMLDHTNIIKCYDYSIENDIHYLHMEYCDQGDVYAMLKESKKYNRNIYGGLSSKYIYDFIKQTLSGLLYIHQKNIIHRDIKLHNILIKSLGNDLLYKISDFGFACYDMSNENINTDDYDEKIANKYFKLCGTPYYMAPEIILNMNYLENFTKFDDNSLKSTNKIFYSKKIDIWSYGICLYELIFNSLPFPNVKNLKELESFYKSEPQIYIDNILNRYKIDEHLKNILQMILKVDPNLRCSIEELMTYIELNIKNILTIKYNYNIESELDTIINSNDNTYNIINNKLKTHIVENPIDQSTQTINKSTLETINKSMLETINISESWEEINKSSSLILKMSLKKGFMDWLTKNKIQ